jgi:molybdate transport system substrate-binding protein
MNRSIVERRSGRANSLVVLVAGAALIIAGLILLLSRDRAQQKSALADVPVLRMYCAAGLRVPVDRVAAEYEQKYGVHVELQYGGSNSLLNQIQVNKFDDGDLYLAADDFYTDKARDEGLADETLPVAFMRPVIAVPKGNPKNIQSIQDLLSGDIRVVVADPEQAAVGRAIRKRLQAAGDLWKLLEANVTANGVFKPTVNDVANDVLLGTVDAGIVWDSTVAMPTYSEKLEAVAVPELDGDPNLVSICILKSSEQPTAALKFARYLTARDRGLPVFDNFGLRPVNGDLWVETPEITFFCGAVNRRAVASVVDEFQKREGVVVNTMYNGCGILTGNMKTITDQKTELGFPDVYMACDRFYLENVKEWFQEDVDVSDAEIIIAVPKGSDKVKSLADLVKPGIRVAIGQPEQCTIGALTRRLLEEQQIYEPLMQKQKQDGEVVVEKASSALLIPDVVAGHVDATIAYVTDTLGSNDEIDVIHIESSQNTAIQPFSISRTSAHKHLVRRLFRRIAAARDEFEKAGFRFRIEKPTIPVPVAPSKS